MPAPEPCWRLRLPALRLLARKRRAPSADQKRCAEPGDSLKSLSDKLDRGGGVICPPDVDPGMKTPAPETGKMPVIPPPGSPGGEPNVQPK